MNGSDLTLHQRPNQPIPVPASSQGLRSGSGRRKRNAIKPVPTTPGRLQCRIPGCSKTFANDRNRTRHEKTHDLNREVFVCDTCNTRLSRRDALIRHYRSRNGECQPNDIAIISLLSSTQNPQAGPSLPTSTAEVSAEDPESLRNSSDISRPPGTTDPHTVEQLDAESLRSSSVQTYRQRRRHQPYPLHQDMGMPTAPHVVKDTDGTLWASAHDPARGSRLRSTAESAQKHGPLIWCRNTAIVIPGPLHTATHHPSHDVGLYPMIFTEREATLARAATIDHRTPVLAGFPVQPGPEFVISRPGQYLNQSQQFKAPSLPPCTGKPGSWTVNPSSQVSSKHDWFLNPLEPLNAPSNSKFPKHEAPVPPLSRMLDSLRHPRPSEAEPDDDLFGALGPMSRLILPGAVPLPLGPSLYQGTHLEADGFPVSDSLAAFMNQQGSGPEPHVDLGSVDIWEDSAL